MTTIKTLQPSAIQISNIAADKQQLAKQYSQGSGTLTREAALQLYADMHQGVQAPDLEEVAKFLGGEKHPVTQHHLGWDALGFDRAPFQFKGDFHADGFGAGNVRTGRSVGEV